MAQQCVSRVQALRGYTTDAAFAAFQEASVGSLELGKYADFVALDRDILDADAVPAADIWRAAILGTWSGGEQVWAHTGTDESFAKGTIERID